MATKDDLSEDRLAEGEALDTRGGKNMIFL